ncbi:hypothetical protein NEOKW01_1648 [Nematocida sp. AWRm80]|nr:hypothetical protein NEOKW01_1648 [Nematocida sp. AWRm80]
MKLQFNDISSFENLFKSILNEKYTQEELEVLLNIKELFLSNSEISGEVLEIGTLTQHRLTQRRIHSKIVQKIEEEEIQKTDELKTLATTRRELPGKLQKEISEYYAGISLDSKPPIQSTVIDKPEDKTIKAITKTLEELKTQLPTLLTTIKNKLNHVHAEVKERTEEKGRQIESNLLSVLFKDEINIK